MNGHRRKKKRTPSPTTQSDTGGRRQQRRARTAPVPTSTEPARVAETPAAGLQLAKQGRGSSLGKAARKSRRKKKADEKRAEQRESSNGEPRATDYRSVRMHYNGTQLLIYGDGKIVLKYDADSGNPTVLSEEHAEECGADIRTESYMNNKKFVGIKNRGPIPENTYTISPPGITDYSAWQQTRLLFSGIVGVDRIDVAGRSTHAGDWGAGRVYLRPAGRPRQGPCGNTRNRSGFFLHGGLLRGSAGCIDIGTSFDELSEFFDGYRRSVRVTVRYEKEPSPPRFFTGLGGALAYKEGRFRHGPTAALGAEFGPRGPSFLSRVGYQAVLEWAGGAAGAGFHLDVPLGNRDAFVRAALQGQVEFRLLHALYGRLSAGGFIESAPGVPSPDAPPGNDEARSRAGFLLGAGLSYDFGPVQLNLLYDTLRPTTEDPQIHQALLGVGFRLP